MLVPVTLPRHLGGFEVGAELGRGAAGIVYRARDRVSGRPVALKAVSRELAASPGFDERFRREAAGRGHETSFLSLAVLPDGKRALASTRSGDLLPDFPTRLRLSEDARTLLVGTARGVVYRFSVGGS